MRTRKITNDYSVLTTHGIEAYEIVRAIGEFGCKIWEAADELLKKAESKDRFDGMRFAGLVFDQVVGLINGLDVDHPDWACCEEEECEKEIRSRVYGKAAPTGVVERALWALTSQLQHGRDNKMSPEAVSTIQALYKFSSAIVDVAADCIDGQGGVDAEIFFRTVAYAALELAKPPIYAGMSEDQFDKACFDKAYNDRQRAVEQVANAINSGEDDVGGIELALQALDERLTFAESRRQRSVVNADGAAEQASPLAAEAIKANPWELFSRHPEFAEATSALNAAIKHAATLATWEAARAYMASVQTRWSHVGAGDSEPRNLIIDRLNEIFGETHGYWDDVPDGPTVTEQPLS